MGRYLQARTGRVWRVGPASNGQRAGPVRPSRAVRAVALLAMAFSNVARHALALSAGRAVALWVQRAYSHAALPAYSADQAVLAVWRVAPPFSAA